MGWARRFIRFQQKRHPREMGAPEITAFLSHLAVVGHVSAATRNQALNALVFLYERLLEMRVGELGDLVRAKRPRRLATVLTPEEVRRLLAELAGPPLLVACLLYGSGLRLMEVLGLRVKDLDFAAGEDRVRRGEGAKGRVTPLARSCAAAHRARQNASAGRAPRRAQVAQCLVDALGGVVGMGRPEGVRVPAALRDGGSPRTSGQCDRTRERAAHGHSCQARGRRLLLSVQ